MTESERQEMFDLRVILSNLADGKPLSISRYSFTFLLSTESGVFNLMQRYLYLTESDIIKPKPKLRLRLWAYGTLPGLV